MVLINGIKYACETCIRGHRSSSCSHLKRQLFEIKKKGRPITQCEHCRELRKTKKIHVKCICIKPETQEIPSPAKITLDLEQITKESKKNDKFKVTSLLNPCRCSEGFPCKCCSIAEGFYSDTSATSVDSETARNTLDGANSCMSKCKSCESGCISRANIANINSSNECQSDVTPRSHISSFCLSIRKESTIIQTNADLAMKQEPEVSQAIEFAGCCSKKNELIKESLSSSAPITYASNIEESDFDREKLITSLQKSCRKQELNHTIALEFLMNPCRCGEGHECRCLSIPDKYEFFAEFDGTGVDTDALKLSLQCGSSCGTNCKSCSTNCCANSTKKTLNNTSDIKEQTLYTKEIHNINVNIPPHTSPDQNPESNDATILTQISANDLDQGVLSNKNGLKRSASEADLDDFNSVDDSKLIQMVYNSVNPRKSCCQPQDDQLDLEQSIVKTISAKTCCTSHNDEKRSSDPMVKTGTSNSCCGGGDVESSSSCSCCFDPENPTFYVDTDGVRTCGCGCNKPASDCSHCLKDLCEEIILKPPTSCRTSHSHHE